MSWEAVGAGAELLGALAVVATIFYLAAQIRQNSRSVEANVGVRLRATDATVEGFSRYRSLIAQSDNASLFVKGSADFSALTEPERVQFGAIMDEYMFCYWSLFRRLQEGAYAQAERRRTGTPTSLPSARPSRVPGSLSGGGRASRSFRRSSWRSCGVGTSERAGRARCASIRVELGGPGCAAVNPGAFARGPAFRPIPER